jgi:rubrerythrin
MNDKLGWKEALEVAMGAELKAKAFYAQAAGRVQDPAGRDLLGRLAAFEQYHYDKLAELAASLLDDGPFIAYESRSVEQFAPLAGGEADGTQVEELQDLPTILTRAIANEKVAGERYQMLADGTTDPDGRAMFRSLANEEGIHQRILEDEFFSISNQGVWGWSGLYGE